MAIINGGEPLNSLKATDPTQLLAPSPALSQTARAALQSLFSSIRPYTPKSPFDQLLVEGFDAEQIWQQIDLQSQPLISTLRRDLRRFEKNPAEIKALKVAGNAEEKVLDGIGRGLEEESDDFDEELDGFDEEEEEAEEGGESESESESESEEEGEEEEEESEGQDGNNGIEDRFFKIKDLKKSLEESEAREYGVKTVDKKKTKKKMKVDDDEDESEDEDDDDDEDEEGLGDLEIGDDDDDDDMDKFARYEDFYGGKKEKPSKRKSKLADKEDLDINDEEEDEEEDGEADDEHDDDEEEEDKQEDEKKQTTLSTHEKKLLKIQSKIREMEKANLEPKTWTMQGEVTAEKRPKNSALEVDLDFDHNVRAPPVITEEVTKETEDMILKRIEQGRFDDVQKAPTLPTKAPREIKDMDENKSKRGLAEVYEEEYVQKTNLTSAPLSFTDKQKEEASKLFKKLCLKLDALSHFHFTPKPVIEDMSVQANIPALAMEEIAPVAVSDAAMLAPEEVFSGKGDIKEEAELTQEERKRRRANKKRKYKAREAKKTPKKPRDS